MRDRVIVALGDIAAVFNGKTPSKADQRAQGHPVLKIRDVSDAGEFRGPFESFVDDEFAREVPEKLVQRGDTFILNAAHNADYVASKTFYAAPETYDALATGEWLIVRPTRDSVDPAYLHRWITTPSTRHALREQVKGIHLYPKDVARLLLPLPPISDQRRIAAILDDADELRAKRRAALVHLDGLAESVFMEMFGSPVENPMGWRTLSLTDCVKREQHALKRGPFGGALKKEIFVEDGHKVYEQGNVIAEDFAKGTYYIREQDYRRLAAFAVRAGDVLISCSGTIGRIAVVPSEARPGVMNQALLKISLDPQRMSTEFFVTLWRSEAFSRQVLGMSHGTGMKNMKSMEELKAIAFISPPIEIQRRFAERVRHIGGDLAAMKRHGELLDDLFGSLEHRGFRGEM